MDFTDLEARKYVSTSATFIAREAKDYEIDMECNIPSISNFLFNCLLTL